MIGSLWSLSSLLMLSDLTLFGWSTSLALTGCPLQEGFQGRVECQNPPQNSPAPRGCSAVKALGRAGPLWRRPVGPACAARDCWCPGCDGGHPSGRAASGAVARAPRRTPAFSGTHPSPTQHVPLARGGPALRPQQLGQGCHQLPRGFATHECWMRAPWARGSPGRPQRHPPQDPRAWVGAGDGALKSFWGCSRGPGGRAAGVRCSWEAPKCCRRPALRWAEPSRRLQVAALRVEQQQCGRLEKRVGAWTLQKRPCCSGVTWTGLHVQTGAPRQ
mmetsp:Transcript_57633/g.94623  ORF Transcript_57633/g.94623 Transcript_57633/m.94623 type:complete len:274 (-) Transcript_57633:2635-3456(-)